MFLGVINLPTVVTFLGMFLALGTVFLSFHGYFAGALICLMYAGICDLTDGALARRMEMTDDERAFGVQIDSIIDMASFGVAPAMLGLLLGMQSIPDMILLTFFVSCAAMRLAYFNVHGLSGEGGKKFYTGLPVTYAAMIFPLIGVLQSFLAPDVFAYLYRGVILVTALAFILRIKTPKPQGKALIVFPLVAIGFTVFYATTTIHPFP
ncbi:MAG: CDP-alcohol phosphatidyltransferase family protein [Myxococcota bacterium]|nr:CDP-alcohol phosphatidyltransferase family protein [Myxococcota bacterium]